MTTNKDVTVAQAVPGIHARIISIMKDCGAIKKDGKNTQQNYSFRGIDAVMNELNSHFVKHGVFILPEVLDLQTHEYQNKSGTTTFNTRVKVRYTFMSDGGESVSSTVAGEGMDSGDKSVNKAMSAALKYCLLQMLLIPTEEKKDSEHDNHEIAARVERKQEPKATPQYTMQEVLSAIRMASTRQELVVIYNSVPHLHGYSDLVTALTARKAELPA